MDFLPLFHHDLLNDLRCAYIDRLYLVRRYPARHLLLIAPVTIHADIIHGIYADRRTLPGLCQIVGASGAPADQSHDDRSDQNSLSCLIHRQRLLPSGSHESHRRRYDTSSSPASQYPHHV